ncbi:MAG: hypothetical protein K4571_16910 [Deltaproteobacteria bacterium]
MQNLIFSGNRIVDHDLDMDLHPQRRSKWTTGKDRSLAFHLLVLKKTTGLHLDNRWALERSSEALRHLR